MQLLLLRTILVATDLDDGAVPAVVTASALAAAAGASLNAVTVVSSSDRPGPRDALLTMLDRAGATIEAAHVHVLEGDPANAIEQLAIRLRADVIVLGPHRKARSKSHIRTIGGTALAVATNAATPCLIVSNTLHLPLKRVLVPIDLSDTARGALLVGLSWASALRGGMRESPQGETVELMALHVKKSASHASGTAWPLALEKELDHLRSEGGTWAGVSIQGETVVNTDVTQGIVRYAGDHAVELVVMGTRGLGLDPVGRLGSTAASVAQLLDVPTLLVPPSVWMAQARTV